MKVKDYTNLFKFLRVFYKFEGTKWTGLRLTDDGFLYFFVKEEMTFSDARYECLRYPGFHLPIITLSEQYNNAIFRDRESV